MANRIIELTEWNHRQDDELRRVYFIRPYQGNARPYVMAINKTQNPLCLEENGFFYLKRKDVLIKTLS